MRYLPHSVYGDIKRTTRAELYELLLFDELRTFVPTRVHLPTHLLVVLSLKKTLLMDEFRLYGCRENDYDLENVLLIGPLKLSTPT